MLHHFLLIIHLLSACIWIGGHLILSIGILPEVYKKKDIQILLSFERKYEKIGIPALLLLIISGIWMASNYGITFQNWCQFSTSIQTVIFIKLMLLIATIILALSANLFVIPKLTLKSLPLMTFHIIGVTILSICFLLTGTLIRFGSLYF